ncbi:MAG: hypothetical protein KME23_10445 [Goleter apudmare HA4340-LM2]|nr:hypothetical protein [Goleter apudmare HA4340-LM2]
MLERLVCCDRRMKVDKLCQAWVTNIPTDPPSGRTAQLRETQDIMSNHEMNS